MGLVKWTRHGSHAYQDNNHPEYLCGGWRRMCHSNRLRKTFAIAKIKAVRGLADYMKGQIDGKLPMHMIAMKELAPEIELKDGQPQTGAVQLV